MKVEVIKGQEQLGNNISKQKLKKLRVAAYCRVSMDDPDQIKSYNSMVLHYTNYIKSNSGWIYAGVYADKAITGTKSDKRESFQRLIADCMDGKIDMVIAKSIPRFARNTLDTLKYVRQLKEKNIAVYFEVEKINTLKDGEFLMTILSSVAQQEVENTSAYVKKGLKMKMQRGEMVGFGGCLGYDYDPGTKSLILNQEEAEIVRRIFRRYLDGAGTTVIARELNEDGLCTKKGNPWTISSVISILKNEKYCGDLLMGKTYTVDPISKRRVKNLGEEDRYYVKEHHEAIISEDDYKIAQEIINKRKNTLNIKSGEHRMYSRQYAFSCLCRCGFCGASLSRRVWNKGKDCEKANWICIKSLKDGKSVCPNSKGVSEKELEAAFVESFNHFYSKDEDVTKELMARIHQILQDRDIHEEILSLKRKRSDLKKKQKKLLDTYLLNRLSSELFEESNRELQTEIDLLSDDIFEKEEEEKAAEGMSSLIDTIKEVCMESACIARFDRELFESSISQVVLGKYSDQDKGRTEPYAVLFTYQDGRTDEIILR